jgi:hypothetical protein
MDLIALASFGVLVVAWIVTPLKSGTVTTVPLEKAA